MIKKLLCQLFSGQCHLTSLQLDISNEFRNGYIHRCLTSQSYLSSNSIQDELQSYCVTLRRLHIRLNHTCFLENLIEHVPNLEQMSVRFQYSLVFDSLETSNVEKLNQSNENWFNKVPKLRYFSLKTIISNDSEFVYLKWVLNNLNYIEKVQVHLRNNKLSEIKCEKIWRSIIDANFIHQYCLPSKIINLIYFDFYVCSECQLSLNDVEKIIHSFKIHSFFIQHKWTNIKCLFDRIISSQHIFSSFFNYRISRSDIFDWPHIDKLCFRLHPSLCFFLEEFNDLSSIMFLL
ncbi:unnamed protein product [Rotaria sordida]|uniref:Uncharacterized protein n=1 Tax=Rotaria sordida TaxID=392033 RepID=A0A815GTF8_9BILA|nr:unnamed protein product [Rotaria sordida]CAF3814595.1 unnamed protein product [Rotaria sordida]